ncbi:hypothetical protein DT385_03395 [Pseudomonas syringae]|nr:hypothetical protein DT385_03395 [Pseudomonas syringae]
MYTAQPPADSLQNGSTHSCSCNNDNGTMDVLVLVEVTFPDFGAAQASFSQIFESFRGKFFARKVVVVDDQLG